MRIEPIGFRPHLPSLPSLPPPAAPPPGVDAVASPAEVAAAAAARAERLARRRRIAEEERRSRRHEPDYTIRSVSLQDAELLSIVVRQFPLLRTLDLSRCAELRPRHFADVTALRSLEKLDLRGCRGVTVENLVQLEELHSLRTIDVRGCSGLGSAEAEWFEALITPRELLHDLRESTPPTRTPPARGAVLARRPALR